MNEINEILEIYEAGPSISRDIRACYRRDIETQLKAKDAEIEELKVLVEDCLCYVGDLRVSAELRERLMELKGESGECS